MTYPNKPDICMIVHNDVVHDSRVLKQAKSLAAAGWSVLVVGMTTGTDAMPREEERWGFTIRRVTPPSFARGIGSGRISLLIPILFVFPLLSWVLFRTRARVYVGHDFPGLLQLFLAGKWRSTIIYDSHELFFDRALEDLPRWLVWGIRRMRSWEKWLARRATRVMTVGDLIADRLQETLGVERPVVVRNAVDLRELVDEPAVIFPQTARHTIVHTGNIVAGRSLTEAVTALQYLPECQLVLIGNISDASLHESLVTQAQATGIEERLHFIIPVPPLQVASTTRQADVALVLTAMGDLGFRYALPNKMFEAIAAGLPQVCGINDELAQIVGDYDIGIVCDQSDPQAIADAVRQVLARDDWDTRLQYAQTELSWEHEEHKLLAMYREVLSRDMDEPKTTGTYETK